MQREQGRDGSHRLPYARHGTHETKVLAFMAESRARLASFCFGGTIQIGTVFDETLRSEIMKLYEAVWVGKIKKL